MSDVDRCSRTYISPRAGPGPPPPPGPAPEGGEDAEEEDGRRALRLSRLLLGETPVAEDWKFK